MSAYQIAMDNLAVAPEGIRWKNDLPNHEDLVAWDIMLQISRSTTNATHQSKLKSLLIEAVNSDDHWKKDVIAPFQSNYVVPKYADNVSLDTKTMVHRLTESGVNYGFIQTIFRPFLTRKVGKPESVLLAAAQRQQQFKAQKEASDHRIIEVRGSQALPHRGIPAAPTPLPPGVPPGPAGVQFYRTSRRQPTLASVPVTVRRRSHRAQALAQSAQAGPSFAQVDPSASSADISSGPSLCSIDMLAGSWADDVEAEEADDDSMA